MIIDFHTHVFPEKIVDRAIAHLEGNSNTKAHIRATTEGLLASMKEAGIDCSVIMPVVTNPKQTETVNKTAVLTNETQGEAGLISFGGIHPDDEQYKEHLHFLAENNIKGIKLHPVYQETNFDDIRYMRIVDLASELGMITLIHAGLDIGIPGDQASPERIRKVIDQVHPQKLVLAHLGGWMQWREVEDLLIGQDVYFDTAFSIGRPYLALDKEHPYPHPDLCDRESLMNLMKKQGIDRFLFATDSPWSSQKREVEKIKEMQLPKEIEKQLLGENAKKLLGIY